MKTIATSILITLVVSARGGDFVDGFHRTADILKQTALGPMLLTETSNSAIYVTCGVLHTDQSPWPMPSTNVNSHTVNYQYRFAFSHLDKHTYTQRWLVASGIFSDGSMVPQITNRRICGMAFDKEYLWLLLWDSPIRRLVTGRQSSAADEIRCFRVVGFNTTSGEREIDTDIPYDRSNRQMWGMEQRLDEDTTDIGTPDYLGDTSIYRTGDGIVVLGQTNAIDVLKTRSSNKGVVLIGDPLRGSPNAHP